MKISAPEVNISSFFTGIGKTGKFIKEILAIVGGEIWWWDFFRFT